MFCCKPDALHYYTIHLDPYFYLFQQDETPLTLTEKFNKQKNSFYLPKHMYFPVSDLSQDNQPSSSQSSLKGEYQLTFSDQTHQVVFKQLLQNPITKIWRVLTLNQSQNLNEGDQFSFHGFNFQLLHLPKNHSPFSTQVSYLNDPEDRCRICFENDTTELNPILNFCKCSGSIKYMHLECCRQWIKEGSQTMQGSLYAMHFFYNSECNICREPWIKKIKHNKKQYLLYDFEPDFHREGGYFIDAQSLNKGQNIIFFSSSNNDDQEVEDDQESNYVMIFKLRLPEIIDPEQEYCFRIGKSFDQCDIVFEHMMIGSPIQCEFQYKNNKLLIKDMDSNEGTNVQLKNSKLKNFNTRQGLFFRYLDTVYHLRGQKYLFSCFQPNITYTIKYEQFAQPIPE